METRHSGNLKKFAETATTGYRYLFGTTTDSDNINDNLNTEFEKGWEEGVNVNGFPPIQAFNAQGFTLSKLLAYLYERGIAEYDNAQQYFVGSICVYNGVIYQSLSGTSVTPNTAHIPTSNIGTHWNVANETQLKNVFVQLSTDQTIAGVKTFSSSPIVPTSTTSTQAVNKGQLDLKSNSASPTFTGTVVLPSTTSIGTVSNTEIGYLDGVTSAIQTQLGTKAPLSSPTFTGTVGGITSSMIGLGSVNNTSDADKPVSTATQTALNLKANLSSPDLTGTPTAPTANTGTNTTQIATTANVYNSVIGFGQTWQNVTASRANGTTYTNSTGKPIMISVNVGNASTSVKGSFSVTVNGVQIANNYVSTEENGVWGNVINTICAIVPNGHTYSFSVSSAYLNAFTELR